MTVAPDAGLRALAGLPADAPLPSVNELMGRLREQDPQLAVVLDMIAAQRRTTDTAAAAEDDEPDAGTSAAAAGLARVDARQLVRLARLVDELESELETLRYRNDAIAAAVGACHLCWGEDPHCPRCFGTGGPGWLRPDPSARRRWLGLSKRQPSAPVGTSTTSPPRTGGSNRRPRSRGASNGIQRQGEGNQT